MEQHELMFLFRTVLKLIFKNFKNLLVDETYLINEFNSLNNQIDNILTFEDLKNFKEGLKNFFENFHYFFEFNFSEEKKDLRNVIKDLEKIANEVLIQTDKFKLKLKDLENEINNLKKLDKANEIIISLKKFIQELVNFIDFYNNEILNLKNKIKSINEKAFGFEKKILDLEKKVFIDELTSVYNRRALEIKLKNFMLNFKKGKDKLALFFFDLDNFKEINDTYGHIAGDLILKNVAELFKRYTREGDIVCRYGGDEFIILIKDVDKKIAIEIGKRIIEKISKAKFIYKNDEIKVKMTGGLYYVEEKEDIENIIKKADEAMYKAKQEGLTLKIAN